MIVDMDVPSECCPLGYEPVELTDKDPEDGVKKMVSCRVPVVYEPYVHYPENWESNIFNPQSMQGNITKWGLYGVLVIVIGMLVWRIIVIRKKRRAKE